jgi:hypothetical protein
MKLDPGMHIGMHLVFFGKSGVTEKKLDPPQPNALHAKKVVASFHKQCNVSSLPCC